MRTLIDSVADARIKGSTLVDSVEPGPIGEHTLYAEQFDNRSLGTFLKRVNIAVICRKTAVFYCFEFYEGEGRWRILGLAADGNINDILARRWPS